MIPKSLHTVTVLVTMAKLLRNSHPAITIDSAVVSVAIALGYSPEDDAYSLINQAIAKLTKKA